MNRVIFTLVIAMLILGSSLAFAQYDEESYVEGFIGGNITLPNGHMKNDLVPDSLNAKNGFGLDVGVGYYLNANMILGVYFGTRNMDAEDVDLKHRVFDLGLYGKYIFMDLSERSFSPYLKVGVGASFSKLVTQVMRDNVVAFRELAYNPTFGLDGALGFHKKTNEFGGVFLEAAFHMDMMDGVTGEFKGIDYTWLKNNAFIVIRAGVLFNIGPKE